MQILIQLTCTCGGVINIETEYCSDAQKLMDRFFEAHRKCQSPLVEVGPVVHYADLSGEGGG